MGSGPSSAVPPAPFGDLPGGLQLLHIPAEESVLLELRDMGEMTQLDRARAQPGRFDVVAQDGLDAESGAPEVGDRLEQLAPERPLSGRVWEQRLAQRGLDLADAA